MEKKGESQCTNDAQRRQNSTSVPSGRSIHLSSSVLSSPLPLPITSSTFHIVQLHQSLNERSTQQNMQRIVNKTESVPNIALVNKTESVPNIALVNRTESVSNVALDDRAFLRNKIKTSLNHNVGNTIEEQFDGIANAIEHILYCQYNNLGKLDYFKNGFKFERIIKTSITEMQAPKTCACGKCHTQGAIPVQRVRPVEIQRVRTNPVENDLFEPSGKLKINIPSNSSSHDDQICKLPKPLINKSRTSESSEESNTSESLEESSNPFKTPPQKKRKQEVPQAPIKAKKTKGDNA